VSGLRHDAAAAGGKENLDGRLGGFRGAPVVLLPVILDRPPHEERASRLPCVPRGPWMKGEEQFSVLSFQLRTTCLLFLKTGNSKLKTETREVGLENIERLYREPVHG
jgi:hypothetical protein